MPSCTTVVRSVLFVLCFLPAAAMAQAPAQPQFKADFQMAGADGVSVHGRIYFGGSKVRMEIADGGGMGTMIVDNVKHTQIMLMADEKMYMEMPGQMAEASMAPRVDVMDPANPCSSGATECRKLGSETVNGYATEKWGFKAHGESWTAWIATKLRVPIKMVSARGVSTEFRNVVEGKLDPSLFAVPAGYRKMGDAMGSLADLQKMAAGAKGGDEDEDEGETAGDDDDEDDDAPAVAGSEWEKVRGWILNVTFAAKDSTNAKSEVGETLGTASLTATASIPLNYGTPAVMNQLGPTWSVLAAPGAGSREAEAKPLSFSGQSECRSTFKVEEACPKGKSVEITTTTTKAKFDVKGSITAPSPRLMLSTMLKLSPDLKSYGFLLLVSAPGIQEQSVAEKSGSECGGPTTKQPPVTSSRDRDVEFPQFEIKDLPLPAHPGVLTGSKTMPMRLTTCGFNGEHPVTVQWTLTPIDVH